MKTGVVEQQHDTFFGTGADFFGESSEQAGKQRLGYAVRQVPDRLARGRANKGCHVKPLEAMVTFGDRALPLGGPHRAQHRLQAEAVLVCAEHLDGRVGVGDRFFGDGVRQLFLKACTSSAVADFGFLGRGR